MSPVAAIPSMVSSSCASVPPPMAILGAVPAPVVPPVPPVPAVEPIEPTEPLAPVAAAGWPAVTLTSDAPRRMPATATATARSVPSRHRSERVGVAAGRSATTVRSRVGTSRDAATTVEQPFRTWPAAARPRAFTAVAVAIRGGDGRCRRPRTRWTPTVALSNTVSWKWTVPQRLGSRRGWGSHVGPSGVRGIELGSLLAAEIPSTRAYDIKGNPNTDVAARANTRSGPRWPSVTGRESRVSPRGRG